MGLVYAYLAAWVVGGVLLGARVLLVQHEPAQTVEPTSLALARAALFGAAGLLGFGLFGLVAEGTGLASGPWAAGWAVLGSALFLAGSYALRPRGLTPVTGSER